MKPVRPDAFDFFSLPFPERKHYPCPGSQSPGGITESVELEFLKRERLAYHVQVLFMNKG